MIIGLAGKAGAGKTTFAKMLMAESKRPCKIVPYAYALKKIAFDLGWDGKKDAKGRRLLQLLGTDICRECIDDNYWIKKWLEQVENLPKDTHVIADDVRFINEVECIVKHSGIVFNILGRQYNDVDSSHASEKGIVGLPAIWNKTTLELLQEKAKTLVRELGL